MGDDLLQINRHKYKVYATETELCYAQKQIDGLSVENSKKREWINFEFLKRKFWKDSNSRYLPCQIRKPSQSLWTSFECIVTHFGKTHWRYLQSTAQLMGAANQHVHAMRAYQPHQQRTKQTDV